jgi:hypothetical protein
MRSMYRTCEDCGAVGDVDPDGVVGEGAAMDAGSAGLSRLQAAVTNVDAKTKSKLER